MQELSEEAIYRQYGRDNGLFSSPAIQRAGLQAWRDALVKGVAASQFANGVAIPPETIEVEYRYRNTILLTRYLTLPDSFTARDYLSRLAAGEPFESLALQAADSTGLLDNPGELGWKYPHQLDSTYARRAYPLTIGEYSGPFRTGSEYQIIQVLGKEFRPDHGHFERVKYYQRVARELQPDQVIESARTALEEWAATVSIQWNRRAIRRIIRSRGLEGLGANSPTPANSLKLTDEVVFDIASDQYTLDWVRSRLYLLLPEERINVTDAEAFQALVRRLLSWDQLTELASSLPAADYLLAEAENLRQSTVFQAVKDSIHMLILSQIVLPDDSLNLFLAQRQRHYTTPALVNLAEIVVEDSALAMVLRDSLIRGDSDFDDLARRHTAREWARTTGGRLGWVPLRLYGPAAPELTTDTQANPHSLIGPLKVEDYYVLVRVDAYREEQLAPRENLMPRLRHDWITHNRDRLIRDWINEMGSEAYPVFVDTTLLVELQMDEEGHLFLPVEPDPPEVVSPIIEADIFQEPVIFPAAPDSTTGPPEPIEPD